MKEIEEHELFLKQKYKKLSLSPAELAEELSITKRMVTDRVTKCSSEIPRFKKIGKKTLFPIREVAKFLSTGFIKVS